MLLDPFKRIHQNFQRDYNANCEKWFPTASLIKRFVLCHAYTGQLQLNLFQFDSILNSSHTGMRVLWGNELRSHKFCNLIRYTEVYSQIFLAHRKGF